MEDVNEKRGRKIKTDIFDVSCSNNNNAVYNCVKSQENLCNALFN